uniref:Uncharacterized protein n=1 Tax=Chromera velia CCMP2878 TaxID=1169474 RepID=A0A0G4FBB1_9ALVE|eukprot:Cvel_3049.t1-p1 / transcript=Cvel_3049.t1 / gene=Cvel_3049 / organism=Chromera_velia_CCMP2878 / gene_product=hypothetical protein / transcript_product=hypothetical protein / location=Cvel_scaffold122:2729-3595(-) / protein_length=289 / sequence_SO=supercontig / SO=protein_coding / is_pseudo=false
MARTYGIGVSFFVVLWHAVSVSSFQLLENLSTAFTKFQNAPLREPKLQVIDLNEAIAREAEKMKREPYFENVQGVRQILKPRVRENGNWTVPFIPHKQDGPDEIPRIEDYISGTTSYEPEVRRGDYRMYLFRRFLNQRINDLILWRKLLRKYQNAGALPPLWALAVPGALHPKAEKGSVLSREFWEPEWGLILSGCGEVLCSPESTLDTLVAALQEKNAALFLNSSERILEKLNSTAGRGEVFKEADLTLKDLLSKIRDIRNDFHRFHQPPVSHGDAKKAWRKKNSLGI